MNPCRICGGSTFNPVYAGYQECGECRTVSSAITCDPASLYSNYGLPEKWDDTSLDAMSCRRDLMLQKVIRFVPAGGAILDIGCGWGGFMRNAKRAGFNVLGCDVGAGVEKAEAYGKIFKGECYDSSFGGLDAIVLNHTLEHTTDPLRVLRWAYHAIHHEADPFGLGNLFISVPNFQSLCSQALRENWPWLEPSLHQWQFTVLTLASLVSRAGFRVAQVLTQNSEGAYHWPDIVTVANQFQIAPHLVDRLGLAEEIYLVATI